MISKFQIPIITLICLFLCSWTRPDCKQLKVTYAVDLKPNVSRFDISRDSILDSKSEIELHFREDFSGNYKILINDSLFFEGKLKGDPRIGYEPRVFNIPIRPGNNLLTFENLEGKKQSFTIKINSTYRYLIMQKENKCTILAKSSNKRPFRG